MYYKIKEVSNMSGVSVRMLHYYDKIGLLKPNKISDAGYRLYTIDDLTVLSQILFYKELDFSLEEIKQILCTSNSSKLEVLKLQQRVLSNKRDRVDTILNAINKSIISLEQGEEYRDPNIVTSFDLVEMIKNREQHKKGLMTHLFMSDDECKERASQHSNVDWTIIMYKMEIILNQIAALSNSKADSAEVQELIGKYKEFINQNLVKCDDDTLRTLGHLYTTNTTYKSYMERYGKGFSIFLKQAIDIYTKI